MRKALQVNLFPADAPKLLLQHPLLFLQPGLEHVDVRGIQNVLHLLQAAAAALKALDEPELVPLQRVIVPVALGSDLHGVQKTDAVIILHGLAGGAAVCGKVADGHKSPV